MLNPTKQSTKNIHNVFYNQLFEIQINLNAYLETSLTKLIDTVHSLSSENYVAPLQEPEFDLTSQILTLVPDYLPNHESTIVTYINFEKFFKETIITSQESIIKGLSLRNMLSQPRQKCYCNTKHGGDPPPLLLLFLLKSKGTKCKYCIISKDTHEYIYICHLNFHLKSVHSCFFLIVSCSTSRQTTAESTADGFENKLQNLKRIHPQISNRNTKA